MKNNNLKSNKYIPWIAPLFSLLFAFVSAGFSQIDKLYETNTTNLVQNERLTHLEQNDLKYEARFDKLDDKIDSGFESTNNNFLKLYQLLNIRKEK